MSTSQPVPEEAARAELFDSIPGRPRHLPLSVRLSLWFSGGMFLDIGLLLGFAGVIPVLGITLWFEQIFGGPSEFPFVFGKWLFVIMPLLIFPVLGLSLVGYSLRCGRRNLLLIENGELAQASFDREEKTQIKINGRDLVKLVYRFETPAGESVETVIHTTEPDAFWSGVRKKLVFYDPADPWRNLLWERLARQKPQPVVFDETLHAFRGSIGRIVFSLIFTAALLFELTLCVSNLFAAIRISTGLF